MGQTITTADIRNGLKLEMDSAPWIVVYFQFVKPGKGTAFTRVKIKNLLNGNVLERTWRSGESLELADVEEHKMSYLYNDGESWFFMNNETFEQIPLNDAQMGDNKKWLLENMECKVLFYKGNAVSIEVPTFIELDITYTEPGARGNTATGTLKNATLSSGAVVQVPLFIENGECIRIDTRTEAYVERVKK